ncbi:MAG: hypothetical protein D6732_19300 [Methanobacteriota archaeon]|nr:MAG: hypothetical protein D6732_19300 [Euryarchaeota archaeon]
MGTFGTVLGSILGVGGLVVVIYATAVLTSGFLPFLWFGLFGFIGGAALGALNSRKAKTQAKYKNEYVFYASSAFVATIALLIYYLVFALDKVREKAADPSTFPAEMLVSTAAGAAIAMMIGFGLVIANSIAD